MTVREATMDDIENVIQWGKSFAEAAELPGGIVPEDSAAFLEMLINSDQGILLVGDGGMVGALLHPSPYNNSHLTGQELFWWVEPDKRGSGLGLSLLIALENAAKARGVQSFTMSSIGLDGDRLHKIFGHRGYRLIDRNYSKVF